MSHPSSSAERFERRLPRSLGRDSRTDRCPVQPSWEKPRIRPAGCSPPPRRHTAAESGAIATAMLGPLDLGVHIVVAEIPFLVGPDRPLAARADRSFTRCDPACPPTPTLPMLRPVGLAVAGGLHQPPPALRNALDPARSRCVTAIGRSHERSASFRGETQKR